MSKHRARVRKKRRQQRAVRRRTEERIRIRSAYRIELREFIDQMVELSPMTTLLDDQKQVRFPVTDKQMISMLPEGASRELRERRFFKHDPAIAIDQEIIDQVKSLPEEDVRALADRMIGAKIDKQIAAEFMNRPIGRGILRNSLT